MGDSKSPRANADVREILIRATESEKGVRIRLKTKAEAMLLQRRLNTERVRDRKQSEKMFTPDDPSYGTSDFDAYSFRIVENTIVEIVPITAARFEIEDI